MAAIKPNGLHRNTDKRARNHSLRPILVLKRVMLSLNRL